MYRASEWGKKYIHTRPTDPVCSIIDSYTTSTSPVRTRVSIPSVTEIHRGAARVHSFIHSFIRGTRETRTRDARRGRDTSIDRTHRSFVRIDSFASFRPPRGVAHLSNAIASPDRRFAPWSVASSARIVDRGFVDRRISFARARATSRRSSEWSRRNDWIFIRAFVRARDVDATRTTTTTTRRARDAIDRRATSRRRRRGLGSTDAGVGDLTSRDSWTCGAGHTHDPCVDLRA